MGMGFPVEMGITPEALYKSTFTITFTQYPWEWDKKSRKSLEWEWEWEPCRWKWEWPPFRWESHPHGQMQRRGKRVTCLTLNEVGKCPPTLVRLKCCSCFLLSFPISSLCLRSSGLPLYSCKYQSSIHACRQKRRVTFKAQLKRSKYSYVIEIRVNSSSFRPTR